MSLKGKAILILMTVMLAIICLTENVSAEGFNYVLDSKGTGKRIPIPVAYKAVRTIKDLGDAGVFNEAQDLFIDRRDILYIADTENSRIVKITKEGMLLNIFRGPESYPIKKPEGIYVDSDGDLYIADTGNKRILHLSPEGKYVEKFIKPKSELIKENFTFAPSKLYINMIGYIYTIKSQSFVIIDANNDFRGYVASEKLDFDLTQMFTRIFATKTQKKRITGREPPPYINFVIDNDGIIYATAMNVNKGQIRKLNSIGKNIYPDKFYGETTYDDDMNISVPDFVDIDVDKNKIISVLDQNKGKIYQYDQEGNILSVFGGKGDKKGTFDIPTSLVSDSEGWIYVLDSKQNSIQVFEPTKFIKTVHSAVKSYSEGKYEEALGFWQQVLKIDENYQLAHSGIAKALMKEKQWQEAMQEYRIADDQVGYSQAFANYRHVIFRMYFGWVILLAAVAMCILYYILKIWRWITANELKKYPEL